MGGGIGKKIKTHQRPFYILVAAVFFGVLVFVKIGDIKAKADAPIHSFYGQRNQNGVPVSAMRMEKKEAFFYEQATLTRISKQDCIAWIDSNFQKKLFIGAPVLFQDNGQTWHGRVVALGNELDYSCGLYRADVHFDEELKTDDQWINAKIAVASSQRMTLKNEYIDCAQDQCFTWIVKGSRPYKIKIETGISDNHKTDILSGLKHMDAVITSDVRSLFQGEKIMVAGHGSAAGPDNIFTHEKQDVETEGYDN